MASAVQHIVLTRPPATDNSCHNTSDARDARDGLDSNSERYPHTPTSSDPASERVDPVALLSRPVDGFHHPRQHYFTDRLIGRFYEDSSLDAETRKTSKCLAGRLGTAGSSTTTGISTRPNTTTSNATTCPPLRSSHSPAVGSRRGKRMHASSSTRSLGRERTATLPGGVAGTGNGLSGRKEQVEKEIMEQKALIEKLEGKMASLSSRGRLPESGDPGRGSTAPRQEELRGDFHGNRPNINVDDRPATTPGPERGATQASEEGDRGCGVKDDSAVRIQRNVRRAGKRSTFLSLQSAREAFEQHLQEALSLAGGGAPGGQRGIGERAAGEVLRSEEGNRKSGDGVSGEKEGVYASVVGLLETSREDGLASPPFVVLGAMYKGVEQLRTSLLLLLSTATMNSGHGVANDIGDRMLESCRAAEDALEAIREALGCPDLGCIPPSRERSASEMAALSRDYHLPAGSGRAAAVATASARGGLLVSPDSPGRQERSQDRSSGAVKTTFVTEEAQLEARGGRGSSRGVSLRSLGVNEVGALLRAHGFGEYAPGFVAQAVDGVMVSDPNLCETDFVELGLGTDDCRPQLVSFFRRYQEDGAVIDPEDFSSSSPSSPAPPAFERVKASVQPAAQRDNSSPASETIEEVRGADAVGEGDREGSVSAARLSPWRKDSIQVNRESQDEIANIGFDANHGMQEEVAGEKARGGGRRMSVKLNRGVVVTMGGREADLVSSVGDGFGGFEVEEGGGTTHVKPSAGKGRRASVGFPTVILDCDAGGGETIVTRAARDEGLPPGMTVKAADITVNIFR